MPAWTVVAGWALIILGWLTNHWLSELRDRRKEIRAQLDALHELLQSILQDATAFHTGKEWDGSFVSKIKIQLRKLESSALRLSLVNDFHVGGLVKQVRQAISLENFEPSDFISQNVASDLVLGIELAVEEMANVMEGAYAAAYPRHFPFYRLPPRLDAFTRAQQENLGNVLLKIRNVLERPSRNP